MLALATTAHLPDGESIRKTLAAVAELDGISVLPWGFGKWTASRGRILTELLSEHGHFEFFLGDNSGRLRAAPEPGVFSYARERGIKVLPGTDPLPFRSQQDRAGSYGFWVSGSVSYETPASDLKRLLYQTDLHAYGRGEGLVRFGINQVAMQVVKRVRRRPAHGRPRETAEGK